jgi:Uma2 family endonuclease
MDAAAARGPEPEPARAAAHDLSWLPSGPLTIDDLDLLPDDHRYELVDGALIVNAEPTNRHNLTITRMILEMTCRLPREWVVLPPNGFSRDIHNYRTPDLSVCTVEAGERNERSGYLTPQEVLLLAEVVSDSTVTTDRITKPAEYADAGVPCYLRVELGKSGRVVKLYLHENVENPHRDSDSDPERVFRQIAATMTGGTPLPLPKPFTGPLDPNRL